MRKHQVKMAAFSRIIDRAIVYLRKHPEKAIQDYFKQVPEADRRTETDAFRLTLPYYATNQKTEIKRWQQFADFALKYGLIDKRVDVQNVLWVGEK